MCEALSVDRLIEDPRFLTNDDRLRNREALKAELHAVLQQRNLEELIACLRDHGVPCGRVRTVAEALEDPQLQAREMVIAIPHAALGSIRALGNPIKLSRTPYSIREAPPGLGEHTESVLKMLWTSAKDR